MEKEISVGVIGAGNVAWHLVQGLRQAEGVRVAVVYSRTLANAKLLAAEAGSAWATASLDFTAAPSADVYLLAVPDQVLPQIAEQAQFPVEALVAHTSGTQPLGVLSQHLPGQTCGVFYPLQTFSKAKKVDWQQVPVCIEASSVAGEEALMTLGEALSRQVVRLSGGKRRELHLAAVFACNFTNHLWGVAQEVLNKAGLPVNLLEPLVQETLTKAFSHPPFTVQTGPAQRGDETTVQVHLALLENEPQYRQLYQTLTASIQATAATNYPNLKDKP